MSTLVASDAPSAKRPSHREASPAATDVRTLRLKLKREVAHRKRAEEALKKIKRHYGELLLKSNSFQCELRRSARKMLAAQEDERRKISRELHDVVAQTLTGINIQLATFRDRAARDTQSFDRTMAATERMVERAVNRVHDFARELRPTLLDDLGLIPALHSFTKVFSKSTGTRVSLTIYAGVEELEIAKRTILYRVVQEALTNVGRHAQASAVRIVIKKELKQVVLTVADDGVGFDVEQVRQGRGNRRLGLIGMRERVEMVGGKFHLESVPGSGTTVHARIRGSRKTPAA